MSLLIQNLNFSYDEDPIIMDCAYTLNLQSMVHLCGANGSGKTTLLKLIAGILQPDEGRLDCRLSCSYVGHQLGLHPHLSPVENIISALESYDDASLDALLKASHLYELRFKSCKMLSLGQQHKVALIRTALSQTQLWLLDEPFANLDAMGETWLWSLLHRHIQNQGAVIFTAHQRDFQAQGVDVWRI